MMRNRLILAKNIMFKNSKGVVSEVEGLFRHPTVRHGSHHFTESGWVKIPGAFVVNHDFRSWRPTENQNREEGDIQEGYAQLQISKIDQEEFKRNTGHEIDLNTKVRFQDLTYSVQGLDQFQQKDAVMYDLKRIYR